MLDFDKPQDKHHKIYITQMLNWCKKNESIEFYAILLHLLTINKHIYGES